MTHSRRSFFSLAAGALAAPFVPVVARRRHIARVGKGGVLKFLQNTHSAYIGEPGGTRYVEAEAQLDSLTDSLLEAQKEADRRLSAIEKRLTADEESMRLAFNPSDKEVSRIARERGKAAAQATFKAVRSAMPGILAT